MSKLQEYLTFVIWVQIQFDLVFGKRGQMRSLDAGSEAASKNPKTELKNFNLPRSQSQFIGFRNYIKGMHLLLGADEHLK